MSPYEVAPKVLNWASIIDENTIQQAARTARMPFISGHVALMPDAHYGMGSTVGSVIPTRGAIIPAAVGVDLGCGMVGSKLNLKAHQLPDNINTWVSDIEQAIPGGKGRTRDWGAPINVNEKIGISEGVKEWKLEKTAIGQVGTLGGGNHFFEICLDQNDQVWVVLHSGSRGVGNKLASRHIDTAKKDMRRRFIEIEDIDLAYFVEQTPEFDAYIRDMLWAQDYAMLNREVMMASAMQVINNRMYDYRHPPDATVVFDFVYPPVQAELTINCHHNFTEREAHCRKCRSGNCDGNHDFKNLWITRKGAIRAREGELGIIPGSMGARSYVVAGKGVAASYCSCSHGAGRLMSRTRAKAELTVETLRAKMEGKAWLEAKAGNLVDEHPDAYKDIDQVMRDQEDLVEVKYELRQLLNFKGV